MSTPTHRIIVVAAIPSSVPEMLKYAQGMRTSLTNNPFFPDAAPIVAGIDSAHDALETAETAAKTRAQGTVAARNVAKANLKTVLCGGVAYIQGKADANPPQAKPLVESTGLATRKTPVRQKLAFNAKQGSVSGSVHLTAKVAERRASYEWQWSADAGKTWTTLPSSLQAKTTVPNLPIGTICSFRYRPVIKSGEGDWSQVITLLVK
jgi:hypothetical protein